MSWCIIDFIFVSATGTSSKPSSWTLRIDFLIIRASKCIANSKGKVAEGARFPTKAEIPLVSCFPCILSSVGPDRNGFIETTQRTVPYQFSIGSFSTIFMWVLPFRNCALLFKRREICWEHEDRILPISTWIWMAYICLEIEVEGSLSRNPRN
jgi:hypothetical protein